MYIENIFKKNVKHMLEHKNNISMYIKNIFKENIKHNFKIFSEPYIYSDTDIWVSEEKFRKTNYRRFTKKCTQ